MSYTFKNFVAERAAAAPTVLTGTGVIVTPFIAIKHCQLACFAYRVTTAVVSSGAVVITLKKRPTANSASGEVTIGTVSIPAGAAAGNIYYRYFDEDLAANSFRPGDEFVAEITTAAAGGGAAGAGLALPEFWENPQEYQDDTAAIEVFA